MNLMNEVSFLKDVGKTPTFLIYNKSNKKFSEIKMSEDDLKENKGLEELEEN